MGKTMMNKIMAVKDWIMARVAERTSWDGATIIGGSVLILMGAPIIEMLAWPALVYPSAYANAYLVREYKKAGGRYRRG
jgi:hypothetical protein